MGDIDDFGFDVRLLRRRLTEPVADLANGSDGLRIYSVAGPRVGLIKAVKPLLYNLSPGTNYQLQISGDLSAWTNQGPPFTATNTIMSWPQYWDVDDGGKLFFRLSP